MHSRTQICANASYFLDAGHDTRTNYELLRHQDARTTVINTYVLNMDAKVCEVYPEAFEPAYAVCISRDAKKENTGLII